MRMTPYNRAAAITASDTVNFSNGLCDAIYVGGAGDIVGVLEDGSAVTFAGAVAGSVLPLRLKRVNSTSTTATDLVALYIQ